MDIRTVWVVLTALALSIAPCVGIGEAQTGEPACRDIQKELEALKEGQKEIREQLQQLKNLLRPRRSAETPPRNDPSPPPNLALSLDGVPVKGDAGAKLVLVEFTDYQCPFCAQYVRETMPQLETEYIKTGKLRYAIRDFPLESIHPQAFKAAEAAHCAADQGKYWPMHDRLFANQRRLNPADMLGHAQAVGVDTAQFQECLSGGKHGSKVRAGLSDGTKAGVNGTPTFLLAVPQPDGTVKVVKVIRGAKAFGQFKSGIDDTLESVK